MELKQENRYNVKCYRKLLIVPYGIETKVAIFIELLVQLLIVPYGIETAYYWRLVTAVGELLIVPYGIETF